MSRVKVDLKAETNAQVKSPVVAGNTITGPVNFNSYAAETEEKQREEQERIKLDKFLKDHKSSMKGKATYLFEGNKINKVKLKDVYTEVFMTEGDIEEVNCEHEFLKTDVAFKSTKETIKCDNIFKSLGENERIVLTKGMSGIGKTVYVQKFILDWAKGKGKKIYREKKPKEIDAVFLFLFRHINQIKDKHDFHGFLQEFYPETKKLQKTNVTNLTEKKNVVFIFDGLDESHLNLDFACRPQTSIVEKMSANELIVNLIRGDLLPSSHVWITSRPAAANQIPPEFVGLFTEVRGFTDQQKDEYFRKKFKDKPQADEMIECIKRSRSIYIMCHIPVFCWITASVPHDIVIQEKEENTDTKLTDMYIHFLLIQLSMNNQKYEEKDEQDYTELLESNKATVLKLAKLAFEQLKKEKNISSWKDLEQCGFDESKDSEYAGMIIEILKKESVLHKRKVFSFVHRSVQEFLAALHVYICYMNKNMKDLEFIFSHKPGKQTGLDEILKKATDKSNNSESGHLNLFLRFLEGISQESSQKMLESLFTNTEGTTESIRKAIEYIKAGTHQADDRPSGLVGQLKGVGEARRFGVLHMSALVGFLQAHVGRSFNRHDESASGLSGPSGKESALIGCSDIESEHVEDFNVKLHNK